MMIDMDKELGMQTTDVTPSDRIDVLDLLTEVTKDLCAEIVGNYESTDYAKELKEWERLRQVSKILMLNGRHVPSIIDELVDIARAHGGLKR